MRDQMLRDVNRRLLTGIGLMAALGNTAGILIEHGSFVAWVVVIVALGVSAGWMQATVLRTIRDGYH